jgi:hypothetical protein
MANIKISQLPAKGANLEATDLVEISEFNGSGYVSKSITGQEIIDAASGGGVTDVTATAPLSSTGGSTPDIAITQSGAADDGYLSSGDWNAFNNKQDGLISGFNIKTINGNSVLGSGDLTISGGGASGIHSIFLPGSSWNVETSNNLTGGAVGAYTTQSGQMTYVPYVPNNNITSTTLAFNCSNAIATSKAKLCIYSHNGVNQPNAKLYESAEIDLSTSGLKTITVSFNFVKGTIYWFGILSNIFNSQISGMTTSQGGLHIGWIGASSVLSWTQTSITYPNAPATATLNSFGTTAVVIRIK